MNAPPELGRVSVGLATFEPGARTAWDAEPLGQTLIVTAGCGRAERDGGPNGEIRPGDVVSFPPGGKHRHGAGQVAAMRHLAVKEKLKGSPVARTEQVTGAGYQAPPMTQADCHAARRCQAVGDG